MAIILTMRKRETAFQESKGEYVVVEDNNTIRGACQRLYIMGMWRGRVNVNKFLLLPTAHGGKHPPLLCFAADNRAAPECSPDGIAGLEEVGELRRMLANSSMILPSQDSVDLV